MDWSHTFCFTAALIIETLVGCAHQLLEFFCLSLRQSYMSPTCAARTAGWSATPACWPSSSWPQSKKITRINGTKGPRHCWISSIVSRFFFLWFQDGVGVANGVKRRFFLSNDDSRDMKCRISSYGDRPHRVGSDVSLGLYLLIFRSCSLGGLEFCPRCFSPPGCAPCCCAKLDGV